MPWFKESGDEQKIGMPQMSWNLKKDMSSQLKRAEKRKKKKFFLEQEKWNP